MDTAVSNISKMFTEHIGRPPTVGEIKSGLLFALSALKNADDATLYTTKNEDLAFEKWEDPSIQLETLADDWEDHAKGTYE